MSNRQLIDVDGSDDEAEGTPRQHNTTDAHHRTNHVHTNNTSATTTTSTNGNPPTVFTDDDDVDTSFVIPPPRAVDLSITLATSTELQHAYNSAGIVPTASTNSASAAAASTPDINARFRLPNGEIMNSKNTLQSFDDHVAVRTSQQRYERHMAAMAAASSTTKPPAVGNVVPIPTPRVANNSNTNGDLAAAVVVHPIVAIHSSSRHDDRTIQAQAVPVQSVLVAEGELFDPVLYADAVRRRDEEEARAREEQARQEAERIATKAREEAARAESARTAAAREEAEQLKLVQRKMYRKYGFIVAMMVVAVVVIVVIVVIVTESTKSRQESRDATAAPNPPTVSPVTIPIPTMPPTRTPTKSPTGPSVAPISTDSFTVVPSTVPSLTPTVAYTVVNITLKGVFEIQYPNVSSTELSTNETGVLETITENWFENFYNNVTAGMKLELMLIDVAKRTVRKFRKMQVTENTTATTTTNTTTSTNSTTSTRTIQVFSEDMVTNITINSQIITPSSVLSNLTYKNVVQYQQQLQYRYFLVNDGENSNAVDGRAGTDDDHDNSTALDKSMDNLMAQVLAVQPFLPVESSKEYQMLVSTNIVPFASLGDIGPPLFTADDVVPTAAPVLVAVPVPVPVPTPAATAPTIAEDKSLSSAAIAGISVGGLVFFGLLLYGLVMLSSF